MQIKVVDMMMGAGKTSAAINFINSSGRGERFIFVTPYLSEVERIMKECKKKDFVQPQPLGSKIKHFEYLLEKQKNIVTTHALFKHFNKKVCKKIKECGYTLIMDEVTDVICDIAITKKDRELILENYAHIEDGFITWDDSDYTGKLECYKNLALEKSLLINDIGDRVSWIMPPRYFNSFKEVYILTYMFDAQVQKYYFDLYGFEQKKICVKGDNIDNFEFSETPVEVNKKDYNKLITIVEHKKLNKIGEKEHALSHSWHCKNSNVGDGDVDKVRKNCCNFVKNIEKSPADKVMWTTFKEHKKNIQGKGYTGGFIPLNLRASNEYRKKNCVAYLINRFMDPRIVVFFRNYGIEVDQDKFATSEMLQFIWRSAIRDGKPITVYVPSARMRRLLKDWIKENTL